MDGWLLSESRATDQRTVFKRLVLPEV